MQSLSARARRMFTGSLFIAAPFGLVGAYFAVGWLWNATRLHHALVEADTSDPGWRIQELESRRADVPDDQNGALHVLAADNLLPRPLPIDRAWNEVEDVPTLLQLDEKQLGRLREQMQQDAVALAEARKLADLPRGRYPITWNSNIHEHNPSHMQVPRNVLWLLHGDIMLHTAQGDLDGALVSVRAAWNTARSFGDEPFLRSQRERLSCRAITLFNLERVLAQGEPSSQALLGLIPCLLEEDREPILLIAWRGERATLYELMEAHHAGQIKNATSLELSRRDVEARSLEVLTRVIEIAKLPPEEHTPKIEAMWSDLRAEVAKNPGNLPAVNAKVTLDTARTFWHLYLHQQARLRCAALALAAEHYRRTHDGRWPAKLADLAPDPLTELPTDPFDGQPMRYSIQEQSVVIYSVGRDLVDDGGRIDHPNPLLCTDVGIRLWDANVRHLPPTAEVPLPHYPPQ